MRVAVILAAATALIVVGFSALGGEKDACEYFAADLDLAVLEPTKAPDPDDREPLTYGSCSTIATRKFDVHLPGWDRHREHTVAARSYLDTGDRRRLATLRAIYEKDRSFRVTSLPGLGPGAFLTTRIRPADPDEQEFGGLPDPAGALPLPATAHWFNGRRALSSVSATRDGATVQQAERATARLAELVNRRPVEMAN